MIMKEIILNVEGIACSGCENRIQNAISKMEGIEKVVASNQNKNVIIIAKDDINEEVIKEKIKDLGFCVKE